jgi:hypothetical protein
MGLNSTLFCKDWTQENLYNSSLKHLKLLSKCSVENSRAYLERVPPKLKRAMQPAKRKERHFGVCRGELKQTRIKECNEKYNTRMLSIKMDEK